MSDERMLAALYDDGVTPEHTGGTAMTITGRNFATMFRLYLFTLPYVILHINNCFAKYE